MKRVLLLVLLFSGVLLSCSKSDSHTSADTSLPGTWKLIETLADPGDGSGTWQPATQLVTLTFTDGGFIQGNAFPQARRYEVTSDTNIRFTFSDGTFINYNYTLTDGMLVLSGGGCVEACGAKFKKVSTLHA